MKQIAVRFGRHQEMIGVLALPNAEATASKIAFLTWNTGISHRVGPNRMHVDLSKSLTSLGYPVLRFDLCGRGDSLSKAGDLNSAVSDIKEAMNYLMEQHGFEQFILHGLCSGAIEAHYAAAEDQRVIGLSMVDTYSYRVGKYYRHYMCKRMFTKPAWSRLLQKVWRRETSQDLIGTDQFFMPFPSLERIKTDFSKFLDRKVQCLVVFTDGYEHIYNYENQFRDMIDGVDIDPILTLHHHTDADHLYTIMDQREKLIDAVSRWAVAKYSASTAMI